MHKHPSTLTSHHSHTCRARLLHDNAPAARWATAADRCWLPEPCLRCLSEVARRLAAGPLGLPGAFADARTTLSSLDNSLLLQLVGLMAGAGGKELAAALPAPDAAAAALQQSANHGSFEWALKRFSQQAADAGDVVISLVRRSWQAVAP